MLAQVESLSGGAGWVGAGMLGGVLAWLLFIHLPSISKREAEKDRMWVAMIDNKDAHIDRLVLRFEASLQSIRDQCKQELTDLIATFERAIDRWRPKEGESHAKGTD